MKELYSAERIVAELRKMAEEVGEMERHPNCGCDRWTEGYVCDGHMASISLDEAERRIRIKEMENSGNA